MLVELLTTSNEYEMSHIDPLDGYRKAHTNGGGEQQRGKGVEYSSLHLHLIF